MEIEMCNKILKNTIYIYIFTYIHNIIKKITQIKISTFTTFQQTQTYFFLTWDSSNARLNSHCVAWNY